MEKQKLIVIAGPTASGKTACAVELCRRIGGEVISADSMQIYRGMEILSARPTEAEMDGVPHHLLGFAEPVEKFSAAKYRDLARQKIDEICARGHIPVLCGGTGLYINAVIRSMDFSERCDDALRRELIAIAEQPGGRARLHAMLLEIDPESAARLHENDVRRVTRAIEVYRLTGITQTQQMRMDAQREGDYDAIIFALEWPRDVLYDRIERRVDAMMESGLITEVQRLRADDRAHPTALQAIGYKEISAALDGAISMQEAVNLTKQVTRNYAKKQMTWFRRDQNVNWIPAEGKYPAQIVDRMIQYLREKSK